MDVYSSLDVAGGIEAGDSVYLHVSGQISPGDYNAVNGDTIFSELQNKADNDLSNASFNSQYDGQVLCVGSAGYGIDFSSFVSSVSINGSSGMAGNVLITIPTDLGDLYNNAGYINGLNYDSISRDLQYTTDGVTYTNIMTFADVATTGSYYSLSDTPTIPDVYDGVFTIQAGGNTATYFTANQISNTTLTLIGGGNTTVTVTDTNEITISSTGGSVYIEGVGITLVDNGDDTTTIKAKLNSESSIGTIGSNKVYAVGVDSAGKLAVSVPWTDSGDTKVTQNVSTANGSYPLLACPTNNATTSQGALTSLFSSRVILNPGSGRIQLHELYFEPGTDTINSGYIQMWGKDSTYGTCGIDFTSAASMGIVQILGRKNLNGDYIGFEIRGTSSSEIRVISKVGSASQTTVASWGYDGKLSLTSGTIANNDAYVVTGGVVYAALPTINGSKTSATVYAPTAGGTSGYWLKGAGTTSAPVWESFDTTPTASSTKPVTSGGIKTYVDNQVLLNSANFLGTFDVETDLGLTESATHAQVATALGQRTWSPAPTKNDYVYVQFDLSSDPGVIDRYERYQYSGSVWEFILEIQNPSFSTTQWATINSGMTSSDKTKLNGIETGAQVNVLEAVKIDSTALTVTSKAVNIQTGAGLTSASGTIKAKLKSETNATYDSATITNTSDRQYAVVPDKTNGYLSVNVPWTDVRVAQYPTSTNDERPILLKTQGSSSAIAGVDYTTSATLNPSTGTITATSFRGVLEGKTIEYTVPTTVSSGYSYVIAEYNGTYDGTPGYVRFRIEVTSSSYKGVYDIDASWGQNNGGITLLSSNGVSGDVYSMYIVYPSSASDYASHPPVFAVSNEGTREKQVKITIFESSDDLVWKTDWNTTAPSSTGMEYSVVHLQNYSEVKQAQYASSASYARYIEPSLYTATLPTSNGVRFCTGLTILSKTDTWFIETYVDYPYKYQRATAMSDPSEVAVRTSTDSGTTWTDWKYSYAFWKA